MFRLVCVVRSPRLRDCLAFQQFRQAVRGNGAEAWLKGKLQPRVLAAHRRSIGPFA
jgi:hypothetical protein